MTNDEIASHNSRPGLHELVERAWWESVARFVAGTVNPYRGQPVEAQRDRLERLLRRSADGDDATELALKAATELETALTNLSDQFTRTIVRDMLAGSRRLEHLRFVPGNTNILLVDAHACGVRREIILDAAQRSGVVFRTAIKNPRKSLADRLSITRAELVVTLPQVFDVWAHMEPMIVAPRRTEWANALASVAAQPLYREEGTDAFGRIATIAFRVRQRIIVELGVCNCSFSPSLSTSPICDSAMGWADGSNCAPTTVHDEDCRWCSITNHLIQ